MKPLILETVQYFLIKLGIKPPTYESIRNKHFFTKSSHFRPTEIMNKLLKDCKILKFKVILSIKNQRNLSDFFSVKNIRLGDQLLQ
jgi:hypothetical protein